MFAIGRALDESGGVASGAGKHEVCAKDNTITHWDGDVFDDVKRWRMLSRLRRGASEEWQSGRE
jgi:hypothetical protein